ncbi:hypothetical protein [Nonomuraea basaltis]|uniref:phage tail tube protein n=1 Tax=Nonomuraea basaltis TaxID=2495887 RepID=UPI00110C4A10|nr:hypothetical protein [Nonomuraea basaltis]TMS00190.1 hypothetical protein EJK15_03705 [Nonomuraea basaltis]
MTLDAQKVRVAVTGAVYAGPTSSTAPTSAVSAVPAGYNDLGYISEDGVTEAYDEDVQDIQAWQGGAIVRTLISSSKASLSFTMIESKASTLELYHKGSTMEAVSGGYKIDVKLPNVVRKKFILDVLDGSTHLRIYVPDGEVTERGEITYINDETISYNVTITCYPVADVVMTKYSDDAYWGYS